MLSAMEEEAELCRDLAGKLLQVEERILTLQIERSDDSDEKWTVRLDRDRGEVQPAI